MVMLMVNIADIKAKLSEYLDRAVGGERVLICRHNKPIAELRAVADLRTDPRPIGPLPGRPTFDVAAAFFEPMPDAELERWDGADAGDLGPPWPEPKPSARASRVAESAGPSRAHRRRTTKRRS
jgi:prevent-host-death family protein